MISNMYIKAGHRLYETGMKKVSGNNKKGRHGEGYKHHQWWQHHITSSMTPPNKVGVRVWERNVENDSLVLPLRAQPCD